MPIAPAIPTSLISLPFVEASNQIAKPMAATARKYPYLTLKKLLSSGFRNRSRSIEMITIRKTITRMIEPMVRAEINDHAIDTAVVITMKPNNDHVGVRLVGWTNEKISGNWFSLLSANGIRDPPSTNTFNVPVMEITAPIAIRIPPQLPINKFAASASGLFESAKPGKVPIETH